jgi:hypothetical protein
MTAVIIPFPRAGTPQGSPVRAARGDCVALHIGLRRTQAWAVFPVNEVDSAGVVELVRLASGIVSPVWMVATTPDRIVIPAAGLSDGGALDLLRLCHRAFFDLQEILDAVAVLKGSAGGGAA